MKRVAEVSEGTVIRPATAGDAEDMHSLILSLAEGIGQRDKITSTSDDYLKMGFSEPPAFSALIAEYLHRPIGLSLYFFTFSSWRGEVGVYVQDLVVAEEARSAGIGGRLIRETARKARERDATHLRLSVMAGNRLAMQFYRGIGLELSSEERIFEADGEAFTRLALEP